jgi:hypothetical protein
MNMTPAEKYVRSHWSDVEYDPLYDLVCIHPDPYVPYKTFAGWKNAADWTRGKIDERNQLESEIRLVNATQDDYVGETLYCINNDYPSDASENAVLACRWGRTLERLKDTLEYINNELHNCDTKWDDFGGDEYLMAEYSVRGCKMSDSGYHCSCYELQGECDICGEKKNG